MTCTRLTEAQRYDIYERRREGGTETKIATQLGRSKSSISRELAKKCGSRGYWLRQAQERAIERKHMRRGGKAICPASWTGCTELVKEGHSPIQAVNRAALEGCTPISHETAYKRIYADKQAGSSLWRFLPCCK